MMYPIPMLGRTLVGQRQGLFRALVPKETYTFLSRTSPRSVRGLCTPTNSRRSSHPEQPHPSEPPKRPEAYVSQQTSTSVRTKSIIDNSHSICLLLRSFLPQALHFTITSSTKKPSWLSPRRKNKRTKSLDDHGSVVPLALSLRQAIHSQIRTCLAASVLYTLALQTARIFVQRSLTKCPLS